MTVAAFDVLDWARAHDPGADGRRDNRLSLSSRLARFRWDGTPAVAVRAGVAPKVRLDAVVDALAWYFDVATPTDDTLHLLLGAEDGADPAALSDQLGAIGTLATSIVDGPQIRVWLLGPNSEPQHRPVRAATFDSSVVARWTEWLLTEARRPVSGLARHLVQTIDTPAFALYPKLSSKDESQPWQMRLDGLEIGRIGAESATLALATSDPTKPGEPRDTWRDVVGTEPRTVGAADLGSLRALIAELVGRWSDPEHPTAVLRHGQAEHALEAHLLTGRTRLTSATAGVLRPAGLIVSGVVRSAQFPTLWGGPPRARYLDALLADDAGRPWAIELKDQDAGGGMGAYLRHGIGQAVLYRHFISAATALDPYFAELGLGRAECKAALAFPAAAPSAAVKIDGHRRVAAAFGVEVIEFPRPGQ